MKQDLNTLLAETDPTAYTVRVVRAGMVSTRPELVWAAASLIRALVHDLPVDRSDCGRGDALQHASITAPQAIPPATRRRLAPILGRYLT